MIWLYNYKTLSFLYQNLIIIIIIVAACSNYNKLITENPCTLGGPLVNNDEASLQGYSWGAAGSPKDSYNYKCSYTRHVRHHPVNNAGSAGIYTYPKFAHHYNSSVAVVGGD